ncbi:MAG: type II 3-dehydroquinate dehydratase [Acidimicrobiaceae bacterium]|nr:type II 3-dehydroquinate dehydratase [Acidimicrobiaceae bacterium]
MKKVLVVNGPNLNMLGRREPTIYGSESLADVESRLRAVANDLEVNLDFFQSNHEGAIIDRLHEAFGNYDGIIINPGAFTHYSYAIRDAFAAIKIPFVEIHISNIHTRETFRHSSVLAALAIGQIAGLGIYGYELALKGLINTLDSSH